VSLVLSGAVFSALPVPIIALPDAGSESTMRLIETCLPRYAPPAALVDHVKQSSRPSVNRRLKVAIACCDPLGDLEFARTRPDQCETCLGSDQQRTGRWLTDGVTNPQNVVASLRRIGPTSPAIFYYSGHGELGVAGSDSDSGLVLAGAILDAATLFSHDANGRPSVPMPARVILAACQSAGTEGSGAGEWFGFSAAALWAGAMQVVATNWPVRDTSFTSWFDHALAAKMCAIPDAAIALREVQLECLRYWRRGTSVSLESDKGTLLDPEPRPIVWAAYCCIGVA